MRMLNYSRDTNPFLTGKNTSNSRFKHNFLGHEWVKKRADSKYESFRAPNLLPAKEIDDPPPNTIFASIEDMDFMDASTISDDACSILSTQFIRKQNYDSSTYYNNSEYFQHQSFGKQPVSVKVNSNKNTPSFSKTEVVTTKGEMTGMTLMDTLNRRRNIVDSNKLIIANSQMDLKAICNHNGPFLSQRQGEEQDIPLGSQPFHGKVNIVHGFMLARSKLKKPKVNPKRKVVQQRITAKIAESVLPATLRYTKTVASPDEMCNNSVSTKVKTPLYLSSCITLSTFSSRSKSTSSSNESEAIINESVSLNANEKKHLSKAVHNDESQTNSIDDRNDVEVVKHQCDNSRDELSVKACDPVHNLLKGGRDDNNDPHLKYKRMLRMGVPTGAVHNALKRDGVDPVHIFGEDKNEGFANVIMNRSGNMTGSTNPKYGSPKHGSPKHNVNVAKKDTKHSDKDSSTEKSDDKYEKMIKLGVSHGAVRNNSLKGGRDDNNDPHLKYKRMLRMGIPTGAVQNALKRDGVDPVHLFGEDKNEGALKRVDVDPVHICGEDNNEGFANTMNRRMQPINISQDSHHKHHIVASPKISINGNKKLTDGYRRTRLHWNILNQDQLTEKSIWYTIKDDTEIEKLSIDEEEFKSLFQIKEEEIKKHKQTTTKKDISTVNAVKVIDPKRANNGGIILARLKMTYDDIARAINELDISNLNAQQLTGIMEFIPTNYECAALERYRKEENNSVCCECEKFMVSMMTVDDAHKKTQTMLFMLQFPISIEDIRSDISIISKACDELLKSIRLKKILGIILMVGNRLNRVCEHANITTPSSPRTTIDFSSCDANGFSIELLSKLNQVKAWDKKTTILYYIALLIQRSNYESLLNVKDDLLHVIKAESINSDHAKLISYLEIKLDRANATMLTLKKMTNHKNTHDDDDDDEEDLGRQHNQNHNSSTTTITNETITIPNAHDAHVFINEASKTLSIIKQDYQKVKVQMHSVFEYFSTNEDTIGAPHVLFGIVASFCKEMDGIKLQLKRKKRRHFLRNTTSTTRRVGACSDQQY